MLDIMFDRMPLSAKKVVTWTIIIDGYVDKGLTKEADKLVDQMMDAFDATAATNSFLCQTRRIEDTEMRRTFSIGMGMVMVMVVLEDGLKAHTICGLRIDGFIFGIMIVYYKAIKQIMLVLLCFY